MIIFVNTLKIKSNRNYILGEILMIGSIVQTLGIIGIVVFIIKLHLGIILIGFFVNLFQIGGKHIRTNYIHIIFTTIIGIASANHINIEIDDSIC